jgi:hypothetical protein
LVRLWESQRTQHAFFPEWARAVEELVSHPAGELAEALLDTEKERQQLEQDLSRAEQRLQQLERELAACKEERRALEASIH